MFDNIDEFKQIEYLYLKDKFLLDKLNKDLSNILIKSSNSKYFNLFPTIPHHVMSNKMQNHSPKKMIKTA